MTSPGWSQGTRVPLGTRCLTRLRACPTWFEKGGMQMKTTKQLNVKLAAAILGGSAAVTAGALSAALVPHQGADVVKYNVVNAGATTTFSTPPSAPATGMAIPS